MSSELNRRVRKNGAQRAAGWPRRRLLKLLGALGAVGAVLARALESLAQGQPQVTGEMVRQAEWISGLTLSEEKRKLMLTDLGRMTEGFARARAIAIDNAVAPALTFHPAPFLKPAPRAAAAARRAWAPRAVEKPASEDELAFSSVTTLASLLRAKKISSLELTEFYLARLRKYDPVLKAVISFTEELAMEQARRADRELAAGRDRGPLHGIPWGAKDLLAVPGYRTTWGSVPYKEQMRPEKATVVQKLEDAGAVLIAKTTLGELAQGDVWFGGTTKNPWNAQQGSSGSSAGSASTTAAGCVGFAIGTETLGSIVSPCTRCGVTGLRPTFGRVSRYGAMALSWSMDKIGPIARSVEDCALVFRAIHGADGKDATAHDRPFEWPPGKPLRALRVGYVAQLFEEDRTRGVEQEDRRAAIREGQEFDRRALEVIRGLGVKLVPVKLPDKYPLDTLRVILNAEASAAFDEFPRTGKDDMLLRQTRNDWPNTFRAGQFIPAVEYIRANRLRTLVLEEMEKMMAEVDVYVCPSFGGPNLLLTNLTGHPCVVVPHGFRARDNSPTSITFIGPLFGETHALALARAYQDATDFHKRRPPMEKLLEPPPAAPANPQPAFPLS
jgi:Asp-tRNA(Asn)/Glu-tRNA(Gln) amidotransferase A subunit family amidase